MTPDALLSQWLTPTRRRSQADAVAWALPLVMGLIALAGRFWGPVAAAMIAIAGVVAAMLAAHRTSGRYDASWLVRYLDRTRPELEDSSALLFASETDGPLRSLQRARIANRLSDADPNDIRPPWSRTLIGACCAIALCGVGIALLWPDGKSAPPLLSPSDEGLPVVPGAPRLIAQNLRIIPPPYTGLPVRDSGTLDARAPLGSTLEWRLRFNPQATAPALSFVTGPSALLRRDGSDWIVSRRLDAAFLYRVDPGGRQTRTPPLHRVDAVADAPPQVRALSPADALTMVRPGQRAWTVAFLATDDYGVAPSGRLRVTLAVGEGENVTFSEREIPIGGAGDPKSRRFATTLDLSRFGFGPGGDMVVQLIVRDNRAPGPQEARGPSLILRWPSPRQPESSGLTGMANTTLPAYFRSQRQIIIDAEKLLKQRRSLAADRYVARSGAIGGDQQILRGRYSQFLGGEESEQPELPTADGHSDGDGHDHGGPPPSPAPGFGAPEDVLAQFGHPHDESPASSLPPETRAVLKQAVDQMWQSERELKQGRPDLALPFAYKALRFIKEVQQATRVFLSRVGPELPPIDANRRMTGKREGISGAVLPVTPVERGDGPAAAAWRALGEGPGAITGPINLAPLKQWARANAGRLPDALALNGAVDAVERQSGCAACRAALRAQIWTALERPLGQPTRRAPADAQGRRYLRALQEAGR